ncbi:hypothetical protein, partial [Parabacteroides sp. AM08-6]|uniref:hypothetical protein n=1 Tax=Parabacteroides sp. AM08-6 TaxID=2292053 RepID=UPI000FF07CAD
MNKRFSTLLATALVAGSVSAFAQQTKATTVGDMLEKVKTGDYVTLTTNSKLVSLANDQLDFATLENLTATKDAEDAFSAMWKIKVIPGVGTAGTPTYSFENKLTGKMFAVKLQTNNKGASTAVATFDEEGNTEWAYNSKLGLYSVKGDSTFFFDDSKLSAVKGGLEEALGTKPTLPMAPGAIAAGTKLTLTPKIFNQITTSGKLFFANGKDVQEANIENYLKTKTWKAASAVSGKGDESEDFLLATTDSTASKNPKVLVVDTCYYKINNTLNHLIVDTLGAKPSHIGANRVLTNYVDQLYKEIGKDDKKEIKALRPIATASLRGSYFLVEDSIVLYANYKPIANKVVAVEGKDEVKAQDAKYTFDGTDYKTIGSLKAVVKEALEAAKDDAIAKGTEDVNAWIEVELADAGATLTVTVGKQTYTVTTKNDQGSVKYSYDSTTDVEFDAVKSAVIEAFTGDLNTALETDNGVVDGWEAGTTDNKDYKLNDENIASYTAPVEASPAVPGNPEYRGITVGAKSDNGKIALTPLDANKIVITPSFDAAIETEAAATEANFILPLIQPDFQ